MTIVTDQHTLLETERAMRSHVADLDLDFEAAHAVSSIYRAANAIRMHVTNEVLRPYEITWTGFVVLWVVWIWDGLETRRAAEAAAISKATLTGVVKTLEGRGWIEKRGRTDDRRLVELHLTDAGKAMMKELYPRFNAVEAQVVGRLSSRRKHDMVTSLRTIVTTMESTDPVAETA
jgi:MarR family transcriptional regulator, organic hydroperoxide resistance regulator